MAINSTDENVTVERSYVDNYAVKDYIVNELVPKYFPDIDVSLRSVGMVGMTSELVSTVAEDGFNMASVLFRETFPNRAEIPESIYSHAAIFQLSNSFANPSECTFLLVLEEKAITDNDGSVYDSDTGFYYFYIDKDTKVYVEDVPYCLDYDIELKYVLKRSERGIDYIFTAQYVIEDGNKNSISHIIDPYIKIRRSNNGYIALQVVMHQCERDIRYESITTNVALNLPVIDVSYDGVLAGFDIFYKGPEDDDYNTQLTKLMIYSQPLVTPFCFYQIYDDGVIRLSFNGNDNYFTPEFNSELKIVLYLTEGESANFDVYTGNNISVVPGEIEYEYDFDFLMGARPLTASVGGTDEPSIDDLQALTVEGYRTANALTTDADLLQFFNNYDIRYGNAWIRFIKRRNDVYERVFGAFLVMLRDEYVFKTNTLDINMNLSDMDNLENNVYIIQPGTLFTYESDESNSVTFFRDSEKYAQYYQEYLQAVADGTIPYFDDSVDPSQIPDYLNRAASFAEFKRRKGYNDEIHVFDVSKDELSALDSPEMNKFLFMNPFLIRFKKNPNLVTMYMTFINQKSALDFTNQNEEMYVQFITYQAQIERYFNSKKEYNISTVVMPSITVDEESYPVIAKKTVPDTDEDSSDDEDYYDDDESTDDDSDTESAYVLNDKFALQNNDLRVLFVIYDEIKRPICFTELWPSAISDNNISFSGIFHANDYITSDGKLRLDSDTIYRIPEDGSYFKVNPLDATKYYKYDKDGNMLYDDNDEPIIVPVDDITDGIEDGTLHKYSTLMNMSGNDYIQIPIENVTCKLFTLYRRVYDAAQSKLVLATNDMTNNIFAQYLQKNSKGDVIDPYHDYRSYIWTNEYSSLSEPFTFVKPLNYSRVNLFYEDYTAKDIEGNYIHDIMDVRMESVPFIRWNLAYDEDNFSYLMNSFVSQYSAINNIIFERLRNETIIDVKFYNTYGRSKNYFIGNTTEQLNRLNLKIAMDIWFIPGTDLIRAIAEIKDFIKDSIESLNEDGTNRFHISNLIRELETNFGYIDHIRFISINGYDSSYQSIILQCTDMNDMPKEERRYYVPEMLVIDTDDIIINDYIADE